MNSEPQNNDNQEVDLSQISKKISGFYNEILATIFEVILFFKKRIITIGILFFIGAGLGFYLDIVNKNYNNQIIVSPFGSGVVDYLYTKIDLINSNLKEKNTAFFKSIGINDYEKIKEIKIEPVVDIYSFVNNNTAIATNAQNTQNFEMMKLLAETNDIDKVIKDKMTSKNYPFHTIIVTTDDLVSTNEIIKPILKYLNSDEYMNKITLITKENILAKSIKNEQEIIQIDSLINQISKSIAKNERSANLIYNNENNQINSLFELKNSLINENASLKIRLVDVEKFVKDISISTNIVNTKGLNNKMKLILPVLFVSIFVFITIFLMFYKKQALKLKA